MSHLIIALYQCRYSNFIVDNGIRMGIRNRKSGTRSDLGSESKVFVTVPLFVSAY